MWRALAAVIVAMVGAYGLLVALMNFTQDMHVFHPVGRMASTPTDEGLTYEEVALRTADDVRLGAWFLPANNERATVLYLQGNAGNRSYRIDDLQVFNQMGYSVLIVDYRSYGDSEGQPTEEGTYEDALTAWRHLTDERDIPSDRIVVFGRSMGAAVGTWLASRERPGAVILAAPFTSARDVGAEALPWLPVHRLLRVDYNAQAMAPGVQAPTLIIHGRTDREVPLHHGEAVFDALTAPRSMIVLDGGHDERFNLGNQRFAEGVRAFLSKNFE